MTGPDAENLRTMRAMRDRDPVEAAMAAIACLDAEQRQQLQSRFNTTFGQRPGPVTVVFRG